MPDSPGADVFLVSLSRRSISSVEKSMNCLGERGGGSSGKDVGIKLASAKK